MLDPGMLSGARKLLTVCTRTQSRERVVIVTDTQTVELAKPLAKAVAEVLKQNLATQEASDVYNIAELGVGLNPRARLGGLMLEDEGAFGVVHIGIGGSITLGGNVKAKTHYDLLMHGATMRIDDEVVFRDDQPVFV